MIISSIWSCQYTDIEITYEEVEVLYNLYDEPIADINTNQIQFADITEKGFVVKNFLDYKIKLKIYYIGDRSFLKNQKGESIVEVEPKSSKYVQASRSYEYPLRIEKYIFQQNDETYSKVEKIPIENIVCRKCGEADCLDDGMSCSNDFECGGKFCIYGICNNKNECYNQNCKCKENEIQCNNNSCVSRGTKKIGEKIICSEMECESFYAVNNICSLTEEQKEEQEQREQEEKLLIEEQKREQEQKELEEKILKEKEKKEQEEKEFNQKIQDMIILLIFSGIVFFIVIFLIFLLYRYYNNKLSLEKIGKDFELEKMKEEFELEKMKKEFELEKELFEKEQRSKGLEKYTNRFGKETWVEIKKLDKIVEEERKIIEEENPELKRIIYLIEMYDSTKRKNESEYEEDLYYYLLKSYPNCKRQSGDSTKIPDLSINNVAIEIKGPTTRESLKTIGHKYILYLLNYKYLIIVLFDPTFNENDKLLKEIRFALSNDSRVKFIIKKSLK